MKAKFADKGKVMVFGGCLASLFTKGVGYGFQRGKRWPNVKKVI